MSILDHIPASHKHLLADETKAYAFLATVMADGSPQVTPVWFNVDGGDILINSALGRVKDVNMRARPAVALTLLSMDDAYNYVQVRGRVVEITTEGANAHMNALANKYWNRDYKFIEGVTRVIYRIRPESVQPTDD